MNKIEKLIKEFCPDGVDWKKLGEVCEIVRGIRVKKNELISGGKYPVVSGGTGYMGYLNEYNRNKETITIAQYGTAGYVNWQKRKFWANDVCFCVYPKNIILNKYLYYFLSSKQNYLYKISNKSAIPYSISKENILKIKIPIPSLETQEKIVKILDNFTKYVTELQARNKQYNYYRDMLLSEDYLNKISEKLDSLNNENDVLRLTTLGEIGKFTRGNGLQKKDFREKGKPVIHYGQIYTQYSFSTENTISFTEEDIFSKLRKAKPNDILIATTSENIEDVAKSTVWLGNEEVGFSGDMYSYSTNENSKYIAYYFQTAEF